jgi:hypothetical protein
MDADDRVIAAMHLGPDDARDLADGLLSAVETAMRQAGGPAMTRKPMRDTRSY